MAYERPLVVREELVKYDVLIKRFSNFLSLLPESAWMLSGFVQSTIFYHHFATPRYYSLHQQRSAMGRDARLKFSRLAPDIVLLISQVLKMPVDSISEQGRL